MASADFEELVEDFTFLEDWEERYGYLIELGKALPPFDEARKTPQSVVHGCASQVWIEERLNDRGEENRIEFEGDSDALIVRGLIAVLRKLIHGQTAQEVSALNIPQELEKLDLSAHLSRQRSNGLSAMITRLQSFAAENRA